MYQVAQAIHEDSVLEVQAGGAEQVAIEGICLAELTVGGHCSRWTEFCSGNAFTGMTDGSV
jgi:hypothetical protein